MNKIVRAWNKHQEQSVDDAPDAIYIDGQKIQVEEIDSMAERKAPVIKEVFDNSAITGPIKKVGDTSPYKVDKSVEKSLIVNQLSKTHFDKIIAYIRNSSIDGVIEMLVLTDIVLERLKVKRDVSKAKIKTPKGLSLQVDMGTIKTWMEKIELNHKKSIVQLIAMDATAMVRTQ